MKQSVTVELGGRPLTIETGRLAKQASGAVLVTYGETMVLVTAVATDDIREGIDFLPLTVDYQEMSYAAGRIPGGFFRREIGRPSDKETLTSRFIDRPIRPLFPDGWSYETQLIATVLSMDQDNEPDVLAITGASAALAVSNIPFASPIAGIRLGRIDGKFVVNPSKADLEKSDMELVVAGSKDAIVMVEGGGAFIPEDEMLDAIFFAHQAMQPAIEAQEKLIALSGKAKRQVPPRAEHPELMARVTEVGTASLKEAITVADKMARHDAVKEAKRGVLAQLAEQFPGQEKDIKNCFYDLERLLLRQMIVTEKRRTDGRRFDEVRPITCEVGILPRTHGSALFTRGETQAAVITTLGTSQDEQKIESISGDSFKSFLLHYNFPPYSVGEAKNLRGPGRREIGHGALAERAIKRVLPTAQEFPYTIRVVSEIMESNGSSSMATVCGGILSLMDAGVPIKAPVAGIAMGLIHEGDSIIILSDIIGDEDHSGDMDFKVCGTTEGITALQMDIKIQGMTRDVLRSALYQARDGRIHILGEMHKGLDHPRGELSTYAPKLVTIEVKTERLKDIIGPGGKTVRGIQAETGARIDIEDSGKIHIASSIMGATDRAIAMIRAIVQEPEVGQVYKGIVKKILDFGAFVEILPNLDGLVHISQLDIARVKNVRDVITEGDEVMVKVLEIDPQGKIRLSRKATME
ncbi:MAG: polyribonucleotide nucleotidyltransferase [Deltaproteobacteria bacterium]|nr:polyribonucleotide nucleotidyltransferase [Deltaproteobacteria bacterium]